MFVSIHRQCDQDVYKLTYCYRSSFFHMRMSTFLSDGVPKCRFRNAVLSIIVVDLVTRNDLQFEIRRVKVGPERTA